MISCAIRAQVYHPNIDSEGRMVLNIFQKKWSPVLTIEKLLLSIVSVLYDPMLNRPINGHSARQYKRDVKLYERTARAWTRSYASTPVASCQACLLLPGEGGRELGGLLRRHRRAQRRAREGREAPGGSKAPRCCCCCCVVGAPPQGRRIAT
jgi:hypothetical protein